jgi:hypothetical protein
VDVSLHQKHVASNLMIQAELFISMARMLGASSASAGNIQGFMRTVLNGMVVTISHQRPKR